MAVLVVVVPFLLPLVSSNISVSEPLAVLDRIFVEDSQVKSDIVTPNTGTHTPVCFDLKSTECGVRTYKDAALEA